MTPARRFVTMAAAAALGLVAVQVGSSLVQDVKFASAQEKVATARADLAVANDMSSIYKAVNHAMENSVVHIKVTKKTPGVRSGAVPVNPRDFFRFGPDGRPQAPNQQPGQPDDGESPGFDEDGPGTEIATGSGVVMDAGNGEAFIATNNHVVADATEVDITLNDGRQIEKATVVGTDPKSDVAVVKIKADRVIAAKWGDSDKLEKGDVIVAFGSPFGFVGSMSHGIVSALNRDKVGVLNANAGRQDGYENFIQVDAAINPGNSGGPLVNLHGEVVGINTAIASRTGSFAGIGFAIPSNQAKGVYDQLKNSGKVTRGFLGVGIDDVRSDRPDTKSFVEAAEFKGDTGVIVKEVVPNSPALNVLRLGDVITELNGKPFKSMTAFRTEVATMAPGTKVKLTVFRDGKTQPVEITLASQPDGPVAGGGLGATPQAPQQMANLGLSVVTPTAEDLDAAGLPGDAKGVLVKQVRQNSAAALLGLQPGDLITRVGNTPVTTVEEAKAAFAKTGVKGLRIDVQNKDGQRMLFVPPTRRGR